MAIIKLEEQVRKLSKELEPIIKLEEQVRKLTKELE